jgi:hypothetical protein
MFGTMNVLVHVVFVGNVQAISEPIFHLASFFQAEVVGEEEI